MAARTNWDQALPTPGRARRIRAHLVLPLLLAAAVATAAAQDVQPSTGILQEYNLTVWTEREGLQSPRVMAIAQTTDGYLWLGTVNGLIRFDGTTFTPWNAIGTTPLPDGRVQALDATPDGALWVAYQSGTVASVVGSRSVVHDAIGRATGGIVTAIGTDRDGALWVAARSGLLRVDGEQVTRLGQADGIPDGPVLNTYEDEQGTLWISSNTGIFRRHRGAPRFERVMSASYFDHRITVDRAGVAWITDPRRGFQRMTAAANAAPTTATGPMAGLGVQILPSRRGPMWVATLGQGLWRVGDPSRQDRVEVLDADHGMLNEVVRCLLEDREENIWIGTDYGLYRLSRNKLIPLQRLGVVRVVQADTEGVWVGTSTGLIRFEGTERRTYTRELPSPFVSALHLDARGALWIATDVGIVVRRNGAFQPVPLPGIAQLNRIYSMAADDDGQLWLADFNRGLFRAGPAGIEPVDLPNLDHRAVLSVHPDLERRLWLSLSDGSLGFIERQADGGLTFTRPEGLPATSARLNAVLQQQPGDLWLITSAGAWHWTRDRVVSVSAANGLPDGQFTAGAFDSDGAVWLGSGAGVLRLDQATLDHIERNRQAQVTYGYWDAYDGAAGTPVWFGTPAVSRDAAGRLWFVTANGLSIAEPGRLRGATPLPPVVIQSVMAGSTRMPFDRDLVLPPRSSPIEIDYATVMLSAAHKVRFRYRLENFEDTWTDAGTRRQAIFTNLPPGDYRFRVMAIATDGTASESTATLAFVVQPAFTQTPWFLAGLALLFSLAVLSAWRLRLRYVQRQFAMVIHERIRMSREIHDTLLQSLIGVALQLDALGAQDGVSEDSRASLTRVRRELEEDIRETRQSIWNLRSPKLEHADLASTLLEAGRRIAAGAPVIVRVSVDGTPRRLRLDVEQQILRITEQALVNAVRHGSASEVDVVLHFDRHAVRLTVTDNGRGFDQAQISGESNFHYGLASMRERAEELGGRFTLRTEPGRGTAIEASVPA